MIRRFGALLVIGLAACGGKANTAAPAPQTMQGAVTGFLDAVRANDLERMSQLWGNEDRLASAWLPPADLAQRLRIMQIYFANKGYRIVEGPLTVPGNERLRTFRVELQRANCARVVPIDVVRMRSGTWVVYDVHIAEVGNPRLPCPPGTGTQP